MVSESGSRRRVSPSMAMARRSGTTRVEASVTRLPSTVTRPSLMSARASDRLASPSLDSARSRETVFLLSVFLLAVVAKLEGDSEVPGAQGLHRALQIV